MAKANEVAVTAPQVIGFNEADFEWENVHTEQPDQLSFDEIGDTLIAVYLGQSVIEFADKKNGELKQFTQLRFLLPGNNSAVVNAGYDLLKAFEHIPVNHMTRTQYLKSVDVGQNDPMKSYRVDIGPKYEG